MAADNDVYDVVQIGYGPVGQTHAALLGKLGHKVAVFERHAGLYALPRAGHVDHEIMRIFQSMGCIPAIEEDIFRCSTYGWRNQHGQTLIDIDWSADGISGWASDYLMYQPYVENALDEAVRRHPSVEVNHGWEAVSLTQLEDYCEVTLRAGMVDAEGEYSLSDTTRTVRARYVVGADGANSFIRRAAGLELEDIGFHEQWLVTDFRQKHPLHFEFDNGQICDPARPMCLFQIGKTHRRFEFMVMPGDDLATITHPERVWALVKEWLTPEDAELIRATVYTFRSANAPSWRSGRVLLIGDAAHLMPPFLGQGMCSGVRDAAALSWRLDLVLRGLSEDALLDSHMVERRPHVGAIIEQAVALGQVSCIIDPEQARLRDEAFFAGQVPAPPPFPILEDGVLRRRGGASSARLAGTLGPQGRIVLGAREGLADDVLGRGWQIISNDNVVKNLSAKSRSILAKLDVGILDFGSGSEAGLVDKDGAYARYFAETGVRAILVRPDFYVFGAVEQDEDLEDLVEELAAGLQFYEAEALTK